MYTTLFTPGQSHNLTRISFYLPSLLHEEKQAVKEFITFVREWINDVENPVHGYTASDYNIPVFFGDWLDRKTNRYYRDYHCVMNIDVSYTMDSLNTETTIKNIYETISRLYIECKCHQKAFWVISHPAILTTFPKYEVAARKGRKALEQMLIEPIEKSSS